MSLPVAVRALVLTPRRSTWRTVQGWRSSYRAHNELNQKAPTGESLGEGDLLDCDGSVVGRTVVFAVEGVDTSLAIAYEQSGRMTVYIAEGLAESEWPEALQRPSR